LNKLRFAESLKFLEFHTELLETPIILSNKHSLLGYDEQKLNALFCDRY
jgi:arsenate reductase-like glutaredoxin family protein